MPEEPSVLDYLKSKLKFWERGEKIQIPDETELPEGGPLQISRASEEQPVTIPLEQEFNGIGETASGKTGRTQSLALALPPGSGLGFFGTTFLGFGDGPDGHLWIGSLHPCPGVAGLGIYKKRMDPCAFTGDRNGL